MNVLGIETATELVGVAVAAGRARSGAWATGRRRHAECLPPTILHVMDQAGIELAELDAIAVDIGPGLFTGLRVGVITAKGLAHGLGVGIVGVGSLTILARAAFDVGHTGVVVPVVDARRGEVFAARYRRGTGPFGLDEIEAPRVLPPELLAREVATVGTADGPVLLVGDGAMAYASVFGTGGVSLAGASLAAPPPAMLVSLALEYLEGGGTAEPPERVSPDYLRVVDAKVNWQQRGPGGLRQRSGAAATST